MSQKMKHLRKAQILVLEHLVKLRNDKAYKQLPSGSHPVIMLFRIGTRPKEASLPFVEDSWSRVKTAMAVILGQPFHFSKANNTVQES